MNDLATLTSQPVFLRVEVKDSTGKPTGEVLEYMIHPFVMSDFGLMQVWIDRQFPDPFDNARNVIQSALAAGKPFNVAQEQYLLKTASELAIRAKRLIGTPEADTLLMSLEGALQIMEISIRKGDPTFDQEKAKRLYENMTSADFVKLYQQTQVQYVVSDPKVFQPDERKPSDSNGDSMSRRHRRARKAKERPIGGESITV